MPIQFSFRLCVAASICVAAAQLVTLPASVAFADASYEANW